MALSTQDASVLRKQPNCCAPGQLLPVKWSCHLQFPRLTSGRTEAGTVRVVMVTESQACPHAEQKHVSTSAKSTRAVQEVSSDIRSPPLPPNVRPKPSLCRWFGPVPPSQNERTSLLRRCLLLRRRHVRWSAVSGFGQAGMCLWARKQLRSE